MAWTLAASWAHCGDVPAWTHLSGGPGKSGTASRHSGMHGASCKAKCMGGCRATMPPPTHTSVLPPSLPSVPLKGQALHLRLPPVLQQLSLCPPTAAARRKRCEQHHRPSPGRPRTLGEVRGCGRTGVASAGPGKQLSGISLSHPARADVKGRLRASAQQGFSSGTLPVAETRALAAQKGFGL